MKRILVALAGSAVLAGPPALAQTAADPALVDAVVAGTWRKPPDGWASRIAQDETQRLCSQYHNAPPQAVADTIMAAQQASVVFPADGNVIGDWKKGEKVAQNGRGGQFSDGPDTVNGGNCYACHQLRADEVSYGTLGPSLTGYGRERAYDPQAARDAYAKVFNAQAVAPCSMMPRFGYHKFLSEEQIKDVVAYLFDPASPVNK